MPRGGTTLICTPQTGDWWTGTSQYELPSTHTTKDCKGAAVISPGLHHNSNIVSAILPNQNYNVTPEVVDAGPMASGVFCTGRRAWGD